MVLKDVDAGQSCVVEHMELPPQMERRLEALGMTRESVITVLNRKERAL